MSLMLSKDNRCFVCGSQNAHGLNLKVERDGEKGVKAEFIADERYRGWSDYLHGGIISLIFDELLGWLSFYMGYDAMTARVEMRYRKPVPLGSKVIFTGSLETEYKNLLDINTLARMEDGAIAAEGKGRMMIINKRQ